MFTMAIRDKIRPIKHLQNKNFICVLENPKALINLASTLRNVSAFGVEKVYIIDPKGDDDFSNTRSNKKLTKLSVGSNKWVFVKYFVSVEECINHLNKKGFTSFVTSSHNKGQNNVLLYEQEFTQKRLAIWFGNETKGISPEAVNAAEGCIQIPMGGIVESLNLGTSTGIVLSYISYQRLKYVFENKKVRFKPKGAAKLKMKSWQDFIDAARD